MNTCSGVRSCRPARLFSFSRPAASPARRRAQTWRSLVITPCALDELQIRLRRPYVREASAGFRLERLATTSINNPANLSDRGSPRGTWIRRMLWPMPPVQVRERFQPESFPGEPGE